jgi:hypothetical protein
MITHAEAIQRLIEGALVQKSKVEPGSAKWQYWRGVIEALQVTLSLQKKAERKRESS